jgi:DNA-binding beta-propeller fold protein YncE
MPAVADPRDIYAADRAGALSPVVAGFRPLLYVPNSESSSVDEIDPVTHAIVRHIPTGRNPQHVVPSWDLKTLWVLNDLGNSVTAIDPRDGSPGRTLRVADPYNMYFTPDGKFAVVIEEARQVLAFRDPHTMALAHQVPVNCPGVDHLDFTADGRYAIASCEFSRQLVKIDIARQAIVGYLKLGPNTSPQDVKTSPDGRTMFVADRFRGGVWKINPASLAVIGFLATGRDAHGLYVSRDSRHLFITNRSGGSVSLLSFATGTIVKSWPIPGGTPDMGGLSADGKVLWLSGRYRSEIYALDSTTGKLIARIAVGTQPHGMAVYPQPGRYSLGHTGVFR